MLVHTIHKRQQQIQKYQYWEDDDTREENTGRVGVLPKEAT